MSRVFESRRPGFMLLTVGVALLTTAGVGYLGERLYDPREARAALLEEADENARSEMLELGWKPLEGSHLLRTRGVELLTPERTFSLALGNGPVLAAPPDSSHLILAERILDEEIRRYPRAFLETSRFRRVLLCSELSEDGRPIPSLPNYQRTLLLDVAAPPDFLRRLVHHEIFHFADYADDDRVGQDPEWENENGPWFVYGSGGRFVRDPQSSLPSPERPGFVTAYAESALEEDKAETFAFMMVTPGALAERAQTDPVLAWKLASVRTQVSRLSPSIDAAFWQRGGNVAE